MRHKKTIEPEKSAEEEALKARVDAMMDARRADNAVSPGAEVSISKKSPAETEAAEVSPKEQPSAPPLPGKLLKQLPVEEKIPEPQKPYIIPASNLSIDKLDELTKGIGNAGKSVESPVSTPAETAAELDHDDDIEAKTKTDEFNDLATDNAVDDIVAKEGDIVLAAEDTARVTRFDKPAKLKLPDWKDKARAMLKNKWTWLGALVVLGILLGLLPVTRYKLLGLIIKKSVTITVLDSKTASPLSNAAVQLAGDIIKTDASGKAHLKASVGQHNLIIDKQYYRTSQVPYFVGFKTAAKLTDIRLVATGRLVQITVLNKITGKPVEGVLLKVLDTTAKTNAKGQALVALPTRASSDPAKLSLTGYSTAEITIQVTDRAVKANSFELTPAGHIYFLSNLRGNIDVVKANLDGSGRKIVLEGTGHEDPSTTSLLASRDWRYLVLKSRRDSAGTALYLIDSNSDKITPFDNSNASFTLVGWYGHSFVYDLTRNNLSNWQPGRQALKSYDAENLQLNQLDQNQAEGTAASYAQQSFSNYYILNGVVAYNTQWHTYSASGSDYDSSGKTDTIRAIQPNGQNKKDYQSFPTGDTSDIQAALYEPQAVYYKVYSYNGNKTTYYVYEDQAVKTANVDAGTFNKTYPTFLLSPAGSQTFWTELRDGKNTLFTGDANAKTQKQIASLSDYSPYGWYSDSYTLISKSSSELYIMPAGGLAPNRPPLKITDYYKPAQTYSGYGYGYGGL